MKHVLPTIQQQAEKDRKRGRGDGGGGGDVASISLAGDGSPGSLGCLRINLLAGGQIIRS